MLCDTRLANKIQEKLLEYNVKLSFEIVRRESYWPSFPVLAQFFLYWPCFPRIGPVAASYDPDSKHCLCAILLIVN